LAGLRTPLYDRHVACGAKFVEFAGWEMPVSYRGVTEEHRAVRAACGIFDVSHMGELQLSGPAAEATVQTLTPNDVSRLRPGRAQYSALLTEEGTFIDDLLVYRMSADRFLLVVNAANRSADREWIQNHLHAGCVLEDLSDQTALLALQGPKAVAILSRVVDIDLSTLKYYGFVETKIEQSPVLISRTGYTGEDGFELYLPPDAAPQVWDRLLAVGQGDGLVPAGLGARDTLRLEAGMPLYGHELDPNTTPWEAGLDWVVKLEKGEFLGRKALVEKQSQPLSRKLVGFEIEDRGIARHGYAIFVEDRQVGWVTSGTWSPTYERALGMAYIRTEFSEPGQPLDIDIRGRRVRARLRSLPFYRRPR
jgi:aminomethyltransferase